MDEDRKSERKRKRFAARLKSSKGISCIETAGPNIVLCNAGRATGFGKENFMNILYDLNLEIENSKFIAEKGETHSFIVFRSTENALVFFNACHGKVKTDDGTPLYLSFIESVSVPNTEVICPHEEPKGITLLNNFISKDEEKLLIKLFDWTSDDANTLKNRQVNHYGYEFRYGSNDVDLDNPLKENIPMECDVLWKRLEEQGFSLGRPDQLTVNKYSPGHGIPSHVDKHSPFGSTILSLSLGSSVVMHWKHYSGKNVPVVLPARSMLVMEGEARYDWQHGIQPTTTDPVIETRVDEETWKIVKIITGETRQRGTRISLTFRWTRSGSCECTFKTLCDSGGKTTEGAELDDETASNLEELHVHQVYEQIAGHFSSTRHTAWPRVVQFARDVTRGSILLDLGAGNGKNVLPREDILQIAGERSAGLLTECAEHTRQVSRADCVRLDMLYAGLRDECADAVICIAVIHHMSTRARRLQAISTIHRLLRPSGRALITVWAKDQSKSNYLAKNKIAKENVQVNVHGVNLHIHENRTQFQHKDLLVPWKLKMKSEARKKGNKFSKSVNNLPSNVKCDTNSECLESVNSKNDNNSPKNDNYSHKNDNNSSKNDNPSKTDNNSSKNDSNSSKNDKNSSLTDDISSKSENKSPERNIEDKESTLLRYYHVFEEGELDDLCREAGFEIESTFYEEGNWCVICEKVQ